MKAADQERRYGEILERPYDETSSRSLRLGEYNTIQLSELPEVSMSRREFTFLVFIRPGIWRKIKPRKLHIK
jgi:hypothetical protein